MRAFCLQRIWLCCVCLFCLCLRVSAAEVQLLNINFGSGTKTGYGAVGNGTNDVWNVIGASASSTNSSLLWANSSNAPVSVVLQDMGSSSSTSHPDAALATYIYGYTYEEPWPHIQITGLSSNVYDFYFLGFIYQEYGTQFTLEVDGNTIGNLSTSSEENTEIAYGPYKEGLHFVAFRDVVVDAGDVVKIFPSGYEYSKPINGMQIMVRGPTALTLPDPNITPTAGTYTEPVVANISNPWAGATNRYSLDNGSTWVTNSSVTLEASGTVIAQSFRSGYNASGYTTNSYTVNLPVAVSPSVTPGGAEFAEAKTVMLYSALAGASYRYSVNNGSTWTTNSSLRLTTNATLLAQTLKYGYQPSATVTNVYEVDTNLTVFRGALININFGSGTKGGMMATGVSTNDYWNLVDATASAQSFTNLITTLKWADTNTAGVTLVTSNLVTAQSNAHSDPMLSTYLYGSVSFSEDPVGADVKINNLPSGSYDLYVYILGYLYDHSEYPYYDEHGGVSVVTTASTNAVKYANPEFVTITGETALTENLQYVKFTNVTVTAGTTLTFKLETQGYSFLVNGIQIHNPAGSTGGGSTNHVPVANGQSVTTGEDLAKAITLTGSDEDGQTLTYEVVSGPSHGSLSGTAPNVTYTPGANWHGSDSFTFRVSDGVTNSTNATVSITVTNINDAPVFTVSGNVTVDEDFSGSQTVTATPGSVPSDETGQTVTYSLSPSSVGFANVSINTTNGTVTITAVTNGNGTQVFTVSANDGQSANNVYERTFTLTVNGVNDAPVATAQGVSTDEDVVKAITLAGTDVEGSTLSYTVVSSPTNGVLTGTAPNVSYRPNTNWHGGDSFTFKVNDGTADSGTATVNITVNAVNDAPGFVLSTNYVFYVLGQTNIVNLTATPDSVPGDEAGQTVLYSIAPTNVTFATLTVNTNTGQVTVQPVPNEFGTEEIAVIANDQQAAFNTYTQYFTIYITETNHVPVANGQGVSTDEDVVKAITLTGSDEDGQSLTYEVVGGPSHGSLGGTAPNLTYTPGANWHGSDSFTFRVSDGVTNSTNATVSITVTNINDAPVFTVSGNVTVDEDFAGSQTVTATAGSVPGDETGQTVTYSLSPSSVGFADVSINTTNGTVTVTAVTNGYGTQVFTVAANDGQGANNTYERTFTLTVNGVNDAPVATGQGVSTDEDVVKAITLAGTDVEGSTLSYTVVSSPTNGVLTGTAPNVSYRPNTNWHGGDSFTFKVNDGTADSGTAMISITVSAVNDAPLFLLSTNSLVLPLNFTDTPVITVSPAPVPDDETGQTVTYSLNPSSVSFANVSFNTANGQFSVNSVSNGVGAQMFTITANDGQAANNTVSKAFTMSVGSSNRPPQVFAGFDAVVYLPDSTPFTDGVVEDDGKLTNAPLQIWWSRDVGEGTLTYEMGLMDHTVLTNVPEWSANSILLNTNGAVPFGWLTFDAPGTNIMRLSAFDGEHISFSEFQVVVMPSNGIPAVSVLTNHTVAWTNQIDLRGYAEDDGQPFDTLITEWKQTDGPIRAAIANKHGTNTTAAIWLPGMYEFKLVATDTVKTNAKTLQITVLPANAPPVATNQGLDVSEDVSKSITLAATDAENNTLTYAIVNVPAKGTLSGTPPNLTYTPNTNYFGADSFTFSVHDGNQYAVTNGRVALNIIAVNDPPYFSLTGNIVETQNFTGSRTVTLTLHTPPSDEQLETVTYSISPTNGNFANISFNPTNGTATITSTRFGNGKQTFTVTANDGKATNNTYAQSFLLEVNGPGAGDLLNIKFGTLNKAGHAGTGVSSNDLWNVVGLPTTVASNYLHFNGVTTTPVITYSVSSNMTWAGGSRSPVELSLTNLIYMATNSPADPLLREHFHVGLYLVQDSQEEPYQTVDIVPNARLTLRHVPAGTYDLYVYGSRGTEQQGYRIWLNGTNCGTMSTTVTEVETNFIEGVNYVVFTNLAVGTNEVIDIEPLLGADYSYFINGIQLRNPSIVINQAPAIYAGFDQTSILGETVFLNSTYSDDGQPAGEGLEITWEKISGPGTVQLSSPNEASSYALFSELGTYVMRVRISDGDEESWDDVQIVVQAVPNQAPQVNAGADRVVNVGETVHLNGVAVDDGLPHGAVWTTTWQLASGTTGLMSLTNANSFNATASFGGAGIFKMRLKVNDSEAEGSDLVTIMVNDLGITNTAPTVAITSPFSLSVCSGWEAVGFTVSASDAETGIAYVSLYAGDELLTTLTNAPYTFAWRDVPQGTYAITARAVDTQGGMGLSTPVIVKCKPYYDLTLISSGGIALNNAGVVSGFEDQTRTIRHWHPYTANGTNGYIQSIVLSAIAGTNVGGIARFNDSLDAVGWISYEVDNLWRMSPVILKYQTTSYDVFAQSVDGPSQYYDTYSGMDINNSRVSLIVRSPYTYEHVEGRTFIFEHEKAGAYDDVTTSRVMLSSLPTNTTVGSNYYHHVNGVDINNEGWVVGTGGVLDTNTPGEDPYRGYRPSFRAFLYHTNYGTINLGNLVSPTNYSYWLDSHAFAINSNNVVVGMSKTASNVYHAFYWQPSTLTTGVMYDINTGYGTNFGTATALNNAVPPLIVGSGSGVAAYAYRADFGAVDLNNLVADHPYGKLTAAIDVNDAGQILAASYLSWQSYTCLLTPREFSPVSVQITSVDRVGVYHIPTNVYLAVTATTTNSSITNVQYYVGGELLAEVAGGDFSFNWTNAQPGRYVAYAKAYDSANKTAESDPVILMIYPPNEAPIVDAGPDRVTNIPDPITLQGSSFDDGLPEGKGVVYGWQIISGPSGGITLGATNQADLVVTPVEIGTYALRLTVSDTELSDHDDITVTVYPYNAAPSVSITSPTNVVYASPAEYWAPASVNLVATASDTDGYVTLVKFYANNQLIGTSAGPTNFTFTWEGVSANSTNYVVKAVAVDNGGATNASAVIYVKVKPRYLVTDMGPGAGYGLNRQGQMVGASTNGAYRFDPDVPNGGAGTHLLLQPLGGDAAGSNWGDDRPLAINDRGEAVGQSYWSWNVNHANGAPVYWDRDGYVTHLGSYLNLDHGFQGYGWEFLALGINNSRAIVGNMRDGFNYLFNSLPFAFYTEDLGRSKYTFEPLDDLYVFMYTYHGFFGSTANGVNDAGQVVGYRMGGREGIDISMEHGEFHEHLYSRPYVWSKELGYTMLPVSGLAEGHGLAEATVISPTGDVAGWSDSPTNNQPRPFVWIPSVANGTNGTMQMLPMPTNIFLGTAWGITRGYQGVEVVGGYTTYTSEQQAYIWDAVSGVRLPGLLVETNGPVRSLASAMGINEFGQIVANGFGTNGDARAFLLTPIPMNPTELPTITLTNSTTNGVLVVGSSLELTATVTAGTGAVARVEFLVDLEPVGTDTNAPYVLTVSNLTAGTRSLAARVIAAGGHSVTTNLVEVVYPASNLPPYVNAGPDQTIIHPEGITLRGQVNDDALPVGSAVSMVWTKVDGPGRVEFSNATNALTAAVFSLYGEYRLRLTATDGEATAFDEVSVIVYQTHEGGTPVGFTTQVTNGVFSGSIFAGEADPLVMFTTNAGLSWANAIVPTNFVFFSGEYARIPGTRWVSVNESASVATNSTVVYRAQFLLTSNVVNPALLVQLNADEAAGVYLNGRKIGEQVAATALENRSGPASLFAATGEELFFYGARVPIWTTVIPWTNNNPIVSLITWTNQEQGTNEVLWTNEFQPWPNVMTWTPTLPGTNASTNAGWVRWTNQVVSTNVTPYTGMLTFTNRIPSRQAYEGTELVESTNLITATNVILGWNTLEFHVTNVSGLSGVNFKAEVYGSESLTNGKPPVVELVGPADGTVTNAPFTFHLEARALGWGGETNITEVTFHRWVNDYVSDGQYLSTNGSYFPTQVAEGVRDIGDLRVWRGQWLYQPAGTYWIAARAKNSAGVTSVSRPFKVVVADLPIPDDAPFRVELVSPANGTEGVVPTNILLSAWAHSTNSTVTHVSFYANGQLLGSVTNTTGKTYKLTWHAVPAGTHAVTAVAFDDEGNAIGAMPHTITVRHHLEFGHFATSATDLTIPVAGMPLSLTRVYDTRTIDGSGTNDFGVGWQLDGTAVKLTKPNLSQGWRLHSGISGQTIAEGTEHLITISVPGAGDVHFYPKVYATNANFAMMFVPADGSNSKLEPTVDGQPFVPLLDFEYGDVGEGALGIAGTLTHNSAPFNPSEFVLTTGDGKRVSFGVTGNLRYIQDRYGNRVTWNYTNILWMNTNQSHFKQLVLDRDELGRITEVYDPLAQATNGLVLGDALPVLRYRYDTNGHLSEVHRLAVRNQATSYETNRYLYSNTNFPHHITHVYNADDVLAVNNVYDNKGRLYLEIDAEGNSRRHTYDEWAGTYTVRDRMGNDTVQTFDNQGQLVAAQSPTGEETSVTYDEKGRVSSKTEPNGATTSFEYDEYGRPTTFTDAEGKTSGLVYNLYDEPQVIPPSGNAPDLEYDGTGNLTRSTDVLGAVTRMGYDVMGNQVAVTNAYGTAQQRVTLTAYNQFGWVTNRVDALGNQTRYTYDANGNRLTTEQPTTVYGLLISKQFYDAQNRAVQSVNALNQTNKTVFNKLGLTVTSYDALGRANYSLYDRLGRMTNSVAPDGLGSRTEYDAEGRRVLGVNRAGYETEYYYDEAGRLLQTVQPDGATNTSVYNPQGQVLGTIDPRGTWTFFGYDVMGRRTSVTNVFSVLGVDGGVVSQYGFDTNGNQNTFTDAYGRGVTNEYDILNRITNVVYADGSTRQTKYDLLGQKYEEVDPAGVRTQFGYDVLGRLVAVTNAVGTTNQMVTTYAYDELGYQTNQVTAVGTTNQATTSYEYDALGRRTKRILPEGQFETYAYDAVGNLTNKVDFKGKTTSYTYDVMNRLVSRIPDGSYGEPTVTFTYTVLGQRATMTDASGTTYYYYNERGWLTNKTVAWAGTAYTSSLSYTCDPAGNVLSTVSSSPNGLLQTNTFDIAGRLKTVSTPNTGTVTNWYDAVGNLANVKYPNGVWHSYHYDELNRLTNLYVDRGITSLASYRYQLGPTGNRTSVTELSGRTAAYSYDYLYRLTGETVSGDTNSINGAVGYTFDGVGNRKSRTSTLPGITSTNHTYSLNDWLGSDTYDANGNTTSSAKGTDVYDSMDRLVNRNSGGVTIVYNGDGQRVKKTANGVTIYYLVDEKNPTGYSQVMEELLVVSGSLTPVRVYTYGLDLLNQDQLISGNWVLSWYGYDGHGSVRQLTDDSGYVTDTYDYDAFGNLINQMAVGTPTPNLYLYTGEQWDPDLGFYYLRARYCNPETGRFWTLDTVEGRRQNPLSLHKYLYCHADAVNGIDPSGHEFSVIGSVAAIGGMESLQSFKASGEAVIQYQMKDMREQILNDLLPKDLNHALGLEGEQVWANYLNKFYGTISYNAIRTGPVSAVGPDLLAIRRQGTRYSLIIGEVKATGGKRMPGTGALSWSVMSGYRQMSYGWIDYYAKDIVQGFLKMGLEGLGLAEFEDVLNSGEIEYYLMAARKHSRQRWSLKGYRLVHAGQVETLGESGGYKEIIEGVTVNHEGTKVP